MMIDAKCVKKMRLLHCYVFAIIIIIVAIAIAARHNNQPLYSRYRYTTPPVHRGPCAIRLVSSHDTWT